MKPSANKPRRKGPLTTGAQRFLFTAERFAEHEMANHAAAGAYAFLLSATPAVLLILGLARALLRRHPRAFAEVEGLVASFLGPLAAGGGIRDFLSSG
ncbi:MAG: hypothetical protein JNG85_15545, partial [Spirochaetaceae bacterium]|nr:hypothetical protein [Spirochaetaceae bacterium]